MSMERATDLLEEIVATPKYVTQTYLQAIAEGDIANHTPFVKIGYTPSLTKDVNTDVWSYAPTQPVYLFPTAAMGMEVTSSNNVDDIGVSIKTGTATGGTTTTLIDTGANFTAATAVAVGDCVILSGTVPEYGFVTAVAATTLTIAGGFSRGGSATGRVYIVVDESAKSGAHAVEINYLDGSYAEKNEIVLLNGTSVIPTVSLTIFRVNSFRVICAGANKIPTGNLFIRHLGDTPVYSHITAGFNRARNAMYTVPAGKSLYITDIASGYATTGNANKEFARVTTRANIDPTTKFKTDSMFYPFTDMVTQNNTFVAPLSIPTKLTEKTDLKLSAVASATGTIITTLRGWIETN